jgi:hypothetical protein
MTENDIITQCFSHLFAHSIKQFNHILILSHKLFSVRKLMIENDICKSVLFFLLRLMVVFL